MRRLASASLVLLGVVGTARPAWGQSRARPSFVVDPVTDGALIGGALSLTLGAELVIGTHELAPQMPGPTSQLLGIDRGAVTQSVDAHASALSGAGVAAAGVYAVGDTIFTGLDLGTRSAATDFTLYAESASLTLALTEVVKLGVRRPRPRTYRERDALAAQGKPYTPASTDDSLSFFSGHTALTASLASTATYLAFARSGSTRGFVTLAAGTVLTGFVGYERVRAAAHFPTDVIAGGLVGAAVGTLVPHLHRELRSGSVVIGLGPPPGDRAGASLYGAW